ncbi:MULTISPECIES: alpha/beta fold hydrolase [Streptomyces]|uniref:Alpha/beta fold hydrolase n=2 Tax=Streptomyces TaxID=1883 RepID=A0ABW9IT32_STRGJ|nr:MULTISPECIES: alpha/beta fold hydrolase [Streptomyces]MDW8471430.1 alpha/beta fold hydrolase [Streptomyces scabiei]
MALTRSCCTGRGPVVTGWRNFRHNLPTLARQFRCLVLEFPGFGISDPTDRHPMLAAPRAVRALLDGLGLQQADVVGNSMGGVVALQLAIGKPELFRRARRAAAPAGVPGDFRELLLRG